MKNVLITVIGTWHSSSSQNWMECESTWVPKLREKGFEVLYLMSNPHLKNYYEKIGNFFFSSCRDGKEDHYHKNHLYISKYLLEETDYEYRLHVDSDSFIHPDRIIPFLEQFTSGEEKKDFVGCVHPYPGINSNIHNTFLVEDPNSFLSGGSGFLLSREVHTHLLNDFNPEEYKNYIFNGEPLMTPTHCCDDVVAAKIIRNAGFETWHDSRFLFISPYRNTLHNPYNIPLNFIGNKDSFLAVQHYVNGHMQEIMNKLEL